MQAKDKSIVYFKEGLKVTKKAFKKEPLFCLVVAITTLSFGVAIFSSNSALKTLGSFSLLASAVESGNTLFVESSNNILTESPDMSFIGKNSLIAVTPPASVKSAVLGSLIGGAEDLSGDEERRDIIEYVIQEGDSLSSIASKFNISLNTILIANELNSRAVIRKGQILIILPVTGIVYDVKKGDTLSEIAKRYKGKITEIVSLNGLSGEGDIFIGDILVIPNGKIPAYKPTYSSIPVGNSYFIAPVAKINITQGLHWYNAVDFGAKCGEPVYASAAGTVQRAKYGYNGGAGNYVRVIHANGVVTMYGHVQKIFVSPSQYVSQGEIIALVGGRPGMAGAGKSTGCHVHFDVRGSSNPFR